MRERVAATTGPHYKNYRSKVRHYLGIFSTKLEAKKAYDIARAKAKIEQPKK